MHRRTTETSNGMAAPLLPTTVNKHAEDEAGIENHAGSVGGDASQRGLPSSESGIKGNNVFFVGVLVYLIVQTVNLLSLVARSKDSTKVTGHVGELTSIVFTSGDQQISAVSATLAVFLWKLAAEKSQTLRRIIGTTKAGDALTNLAAKQLNTPRIIDWVGPPLSFLMPQTTQQILSVFFMMVLYFIVTALRNGIQTSFIGKTGLEHIQEQYRRAGLDTDNNYVNGSIVKFMLFFMAVTYYCDTQAVLDFVSQTPETRDKQAQGKLERSIGYLVRTGKTEEVDNAYLRATGLNRLSMIELEAYLRLKSFCSALEDADRQNFPNDLGHAINDFSNVNEQSQHTASDDFHALLTKIKQLLAKTNLDISNALQSSRDNLRAAEAVNRGVISRPAAQHEGASTSFEAQEWINNFMEALGIQNAQQAAERSLDQTSYIQDRLEDESSQRDLENSRKQAKEQIQRDKMRIQKQVESAQQEARDELLKSTFNSTAVNDSVKKLTKVIFSLQEEEENVNEDQIRRRLQTTQDIATTNRISRKRTAHQARVQKALRTTRVHGQPQPLPNQQALTFINKLLEFSETYESVAGANTNAYNRWINTITDNMLATLDLEKPDQAEEIIVLFFNDLFTEENDQGEQVHHSLAATDAGGSGNPNRDQAVAAQRFLRIKSAVDEYSKGASSSRTLSLYDYISQKINSGEDSDDLPAIDDNATMIIFQKIQDFADEKTSTMENGSDIASHYSGRSGRGQIFTSGHHPLHASAEGSVQTTDTANEEEDVVASTLAALGVGGGLIANN